MAGFQMAVFLCDFDFDFDLFAQDKFILVVDDDMVLESCSLADANFQWRVIRQKANVIFIVQNQVINWIELFNVSSTLKGWRHLGIK